MLTRILSKTEQDLYGANMALVLEAADAAAATDATAVNVLSVPAGMKVQVVGMKLVTAFDGTGTGNLTISVGDGDSATALMAAVQVALDDTEILYHVGGSPKVYLAADTVDVFWDTTGVAITVYNTGKLVIYLAVNDMNKWPIT